MQEMLTIKESIEVLNDGNRVWEFFSHQNNYKGGTFDKLSFSTRENLKENMHDELCYMTRLSDGRYMIRFAGRCKWKSVE